MIRSRTKKHLGIFIFYTCLSCLWVNTAQATTWFAGSDHVGKVNVEVETIPATHASFVTWHCDGNNCKLTGNYGTGLSLESCQHLVRKIGKIHYYGNNANKLWSRHGDTQAKNMLKRCNAVAK